MGEMFRGCTGRTLANGLRWLNEPPSWEFTEEGLTVTPRGGTDYFRPPTGGTSDDACFLHMPVSGDFTAVVSASARLVGFGDAAALAVRADPSRWAKVCLERSPAGEVSIVSVVTDGLSDDANNELLAAPSCHLRLTRAGSVFGMHFSLDGRRWRFVRTFALEVPAQVMVGLVAQAPFVPGCRASFASFTVAAGAVKDFRSGE
jgi:uncharacterized protein